MTTELRATGLSEEQRDELAKQLETRGIGGWESAGEPREIIGEDEDAHYGPQKFGFSIPADGETDLASLTRWLDSQGIAHALGQVQQVDLAAQLEQQQAEDAELEQQREQRQAELEQQQEDAPPLTSGKHVDDTKEQDA